MSQKVSVIIPTFNRGYCITEAVNSVLRQTYRNFEIIVVDDASLDGTEKIITDIGNGQIKYIRNAANLGSGQSRNVGVRESAGEILAFLDSDDIWNPKKLERLVDYMNQGYDFVFSKCTFIGGDLPPQVFPEEEWTVHAKENICHALACKNGADTSTMLIKRETFDSVGGFCPELHSYEDWEFAIRVSKTAKTGFMEESLVDKRRSSAGVNDIYFHAQEHINSILKICAASNPLASNDSGIWDSRMDLFIRVCTFLDEKDEKSAVKQMGRILKFEPWLFERYYELEKSCKKIYYRELMLHKLLALQGTSAIAERLEQCGVRSIAVYGLGLLGKFMVNQFITGGINVKYTLDRNPTVYCGIPSYKAGEEPEPADAIIITAFHYGRLIWELHRLYDPKGVQILSLEEVT